MKTNRQTNYDVTRATLATVKGLQLWTLILYVLLGLTLYNTTVIKRDLYQLMLRPPVVITTPNGTGPRAKADTSPLIEATCEAGGQSNPVPKDTAI